MSDWVAFCAAVLALLATPGPTNTLLATSGAVAGIRRSLALIFSEIGGYLIAIGVWCLAVGPLVQTTPYAAPALHLACGAYVLYVASKLWGEGASPQHSNEPIGQARVFATTLLNPKGIIFAFVIIPYLREGRVVDALPYLAALSAMICVVALGWISAGALLRAQQPLPCDGALIRRAGAVVLGVFAVVVTTSAFRY